MLCRSVAIFAGSLLVITVGAAFTASASGAENAPLHDTIDWNEFDWRLPRTGLLRIARLIGELDTEAANRYAEKTRFHANWDSLGDEAFAALSSAEQDKRRKNADELVARAYVTVIDRVDRVGGIDVTGRGQRTAVRFSDEVVLRALGRLHTAVGTDPTNVAAWYHLAYFSAAVGDADVTTLARRRLLALTAAPDPRRIRIILDEAWDLRDAGRYDAADVWLDGHDSELARAAPAAHALAPPVEANLIRALLAAERGDRIEAKQRLTRLPLIEIDVAGDEYESDVLRNWVHIWIDLFSDEPDLATFHLGYERAHRLPAGINWRYWQDLGLASEALDDLVGARLFWTHACRYRPFVGFYPVTVARGSDDILEKTATGEPYFLAFRRFFTTGSIWGYAATRVLACQIHDHDDNPQLWTLAYAALDLCVRRGIHATEARLLRARLDLQRGDWRAAQADLEDAAADLIAGAQSQADVAFLRGVAALNSGDLAGADEWLTRCVNLDPDHVRGWQTLAIAASYGDRDEDALFAFEQAARLRPRDGANYFNRGLWHLYNGRTEEAEADFFQASQLLANNQRAITMLQAVATNREVALDFTPQPVRLVASDSEREMAARLDRLLSGEGTDPQVIEMLNGDRDERDLWFDLLERRYRDEPTEAHRLQLAEARALIGDEKGVVDLLEPAWPSGLSARERTLLLDADRSRGDVDRAAAVASGEVPVALLDVPALVRVVTILQDHGRTEDARRVFAEAQAARPDDPALEELAARML